MNKIRLVNQIVYLLILVSVIFIGKILADTIKFSTMSNFLFQFILFITFGGLLGVDAIKNERMKLGRWRFNVYRSIVLGIPSLFFSLFMFLFYSNVRLLSLLILPFEQLINSNISFIMLFQILLGYVVVTCFEKNDKP